MVRKKEHKVATIVKGSHTIAGISPQEVMLLIYYNIHTRLCVLLYTMTFTNPLIIRTYPVECNLGRFFHYIT